MLRKNENIWRQMLVFVLVFGILFLIGITAYESIGIEITVLTYLCLVLTSIVVQWRIK